MCEKISFVLDSLARLEIASRRKYAEGERSLKRHVYQHRNALNTA